MSERFGSLDKIAEGGMGTVYRATDQRTGRVVAIKLLRELRDVARFAVEAELLARLEHPGIVRYVDHGHTDDGLPFLAMEWIDGETLKDVLARGPLTFDDAVALMRRLASALGAAHVHGAIHRDIKPSNVLLPGGVVAEAKLIDFGVARLADGDGRLTRTGVVVGTPGYMAPEQARANRTIDARADVFGLGCLIYECLAGRPPFGGGHAIAARLRVLMSEPRPLTALAPHVPRALADLIHRMLERDADLRPSSGNAVLDALDALREVDSPEPRRPRRTSDLAGCYFILAIPDEEISGPDQVTIATTGYDGDMAATENRLRVLAAEHDGALCMMCDGAYAIRIDSGNDSAGRAGDLALALREREPEVAILVSCLPLDGDVAQALERSADALIGSAVQDMVAAVDRDRRPIYVDSGAAGALADAFDVAVSGKRRVLIGRKETA